MKSSKGNPFETGSKNESWWMEIDQQSDLESLQVYKEAKDLLIKNDDLKVPDDEDDFFNRLHDKIMAGVEMTTPKKDDRTIWQKHRRILRCVSAAAMAFAVLLVGMETQQVKLTQDSTDQVLSDAVSRSPDLQSTVLVYENKDDFFVDLAQESLDHLSVDRLQGLMGSEITD